MIVSREEEALGRAVFDAGRVALRRGEAVHSVRGDSVIPPGERRTTPPKMHLTA